MPINSSAIVTGTGSSLGTGALSAPKFRHATLGKWRVHYWPDGGGAQAFVNVPGVGWVIDTEDDMPHQIWIALLQAVDAPTDSGAMCATHRLRKARFWIYWHDGIVKITVTEDKPVELVYGGETDEGSSWHSERYSIEDGVLVRQVTVWGHDCDGRHEARADSIWSPELGTVPMVDFTSRGEKFELPEHRPNWMDKGDLWQRDYAAEAAGY